MAEQGYQAVLRMISDGETVTEVAAWCGVSRQTLHAWLAKYEASGLEGLVDGSHRPRSCPHQMISPVEVQVEGEVAVLELRRAHPSWGPRRSHYELAERVGYLSVSGASWVDRPRWAPVSSETVEAVGTWAAQRAGADGRGGRGGPS